MFARHLSKTSSRCLERGDIVTPKTSSRCLPGFALMQSLPTSHPAFTCSKLTIETLEQGVKYIQS